MSAAGVEPDKRAGLHGAVVCEDEHVGGEGSRDRCPGDCSERVVAEERRLWEEAVLPRAAPRVRRGRRRQQDDDDEEEEDEGEVEEADGEEGDACAAAREPDVRHHLPGCDTAPGACKRGASMVPRFPRLCARSPPPRLVVAAFWGPTSNVVNSDRTGAATVRPTMPTPTRSAKISIGRKGQMTLWRSCGCSLLGVKPNFVKDSRSREGRVFHTNKQVGGGWPVPSDRGRTAARVTTVEAALWRHWHQRWPRVQVKQITNRNWR